MMNRRAAPTVTIPERLELEYMLDQRRLVRDLSFVTIASLHERQDSQELLAFLNLSAPQVLNEKLLRQRLRHLANRMTTEKIAELSALLGRPVQWPMAGTIAGWIDRQAAAVQSTITQWLYLASEEVRRAELGGLALVSTKKSIKRLAATVSKQAESKASAAVLQLNSELIKEIAEGAGSTHYRWVTTLDGRARTWHEDLNLSVQSWAKPPLGGGTKSGDRGAPGSGYGCRCTADPLPGRPPALG